MIDGTATGAWQYRERRRGVRGAWLRGVRIVTVGLFGLLAGTGALLEPSSVLVAGPMAAVVGAYAVFGLRRGAAHELPALPHPVLVAGWAGALPAAVSGSHALGAWGGLAAALALSGSAVLLGCWIGADPPPGPGPQATSAWDEGSMRQVLAAMPTDLLLDEWRTTAGDRPRGRSADGLAVVRLRDLLIDELQSRDPDGVARWLREGPTEPPARFIRPDSPSTDDQVH